MIATSVFARYARALADVVLETGEEDVVLRDLQTYREIFRVVPKVLETFHSPAVPRDAKVRILSDLLEKYPVSRTAGNFLRILLDHHRIFYFQEILDYFVRTVNERKGIVAAQVTSAIPLSDQEMAGLRESLDRATGNRVTLAARTDPGLLGGLVVQIGSRIYDGSIRKQLEEMRRRLAGT